MLALNTSVSGQHCVSYSCDNPLEGGRAAYTHALCPSGHSVLHCDRVA